MKKETLIVSFFGGPGSGKSTQSYGLAYKLKMKGVNCEYINEFAKDKTWEKNNTALANQLFISCNQIYKQECVEGQVDVIISDSPIILGLFYWNDQNKEKFTHYKNLLIETFSEKNNLNVYVRRKKAYNPIGRNQTEEQAKELDVKIGNFLSDNKLPYVTIDGTVAGLEEIYNIVAQKLGI
jgi:adenylate kinase family enzyme